MGLRIFAEDPAGPLLRKTLLELVCDGDHGLFPATRARFEQENYVAQRSAATRLGWRAGAPLTKGGMRVRGPCCPGKVNEDE
jgi:hypothetical protein